MGKDRVVRDFGAFSALVARHHGVRRYVERAIENEAEIAIPSVVIAESTTGTSRDAELNRVLGALDLVVIPLDESIARDASYLRYRARRSTRDRIDAVVMATNDLAPRSTIITGDLDDFSLLSAVRRRTFVISFDDL